MLVVNKKTKFNDKLNKIHMFVFDFLKQDRQILKVNLFFVSKLRIKNINHKYRNINKTTDVLSFPYTNCKPNESICIDEYKNFVNHEDGTLDIGDIFISLAVAKKKSKEYEFTLSDEVGFLYVHALLHLFGYDHIKEDDQKIMEDLQQKIMRDSNLFEVIYE